MALSYGLSGYHNALSKMQSAAGRLHHVHSSTNVAESFDDNAQQTRVTAELPFAPPPPRQDSGHAPLSDEHSSSVPKAVVDLIMARRQAAASATSIRIADDMLAEVLDMKV